MPEYRISKELAQAVLDYLAQRPYREVFGVIAALQQMPELPTTEEAKLGGGDDPKSPRA